MENISRLPLTVNVALPPVKDAEIEFSRLLTSKFDLDNTVPYELSVGVARGEVRP